MPIRYFLCYQLLKKQQVLIEFQNAIKQLLLGVEQPSLGV
jgi:hypothetical protein